MRSTVPTTSAVAASGVPPTGIGEGQRGAGWKRESELGGLDMLRWREGRSWAAADWTRRAECTERVHCTLLARGHRVHWHAEDFRRCHTMSWVLSLQHFAKKCAGLAKWCIGGDKRELQSFWIETCSKH